MFSTAFDNSLHAFSIVTKDKLKNNLFFDLSPRPPLERRLAPPK
jgi:hypothetical protein